MKYYSKEDNGIEYSDPLTYAFIVDLDNGEFANPFDVIEDFPVFKRVPYANYTQDGESYGTKVLLVSNVDKTGACYVLNKSVAEMGIKDDIVSSEQLIDYMFQNTDIERIDAISSIQNHASKKVMEKAGMHYEGLLQHYYKTRDGFHDCTLYGIIRNEWERTY